jgi:hypothetical protein
MIEVSDAAAELIETRSYRTLLSVQSWLGGELLADDVPVSSASEETDRTLSVPERVTFTVPRRYRGESWSPVADDSPVAANGQQLRVQLGVGLAGPQVEYWQRGWFVIQDSEVSGDSVSVSAVGLLTLIDEAKLVSPYQPSGTLVSTLRGLIEPALTVVVDDALDDRAVPSGVNYDEDRLGAVYELLDAWPADVRTTEEGYLHVTAPAAAGSSVRSLTNGAGGTIIRATGRSTREQGFNAVVARGTDAAGTQIQGVAYASSDGPKGYGSAFNPLPVPYFFSSPLLTTVAQCQAAAATILARLQRESAAQTFEVECVPDGRLVAGDVVTVTTDDVADLECSIESLRLPYRADGGAMTLRVRSLT